MAPPEFTIDSADIIRLILGHLTSQGLHKSALTLAQESGVGLKGLVNSSIPDQCRQGDWGSVLRALSLCQDDSLLHAQVQEQVILELAESGDSALPLAYSTLKVSREDLDQITAEEAEREESNEKLSKARNLEQRLAQVASNPHKYSGDENATERRNVLYGSTSKQARRNQLADTLKQQRLVPLNRLPILIQQAMKWQSHTGQLPWIKELYDDTGNDGAKKKRKKRKHLDLVMGDVAGDTHVIVGEPLMVDEEDTEPIPQDILQKVKFGKSAVCESAIFFSKGLVTGSSDGLLEVWDNDFQDLNTRDYPYQADSVMGHSDSAILSLSLSNDSELLASGDGTGKVKIWKLASGKCLRQYQAHDQAVTCLSLSRDASRLLTGSADGTCREFGLVTQHVLQEYNGHTSYLHSCQYVIQWNSSNSRSKQEDAVSWVVTGSADGTVRLWQKGQSIRILQPNDIASTKSLAIDPTRILSESPAIHTVVPLIQQPNHLLVVPRSSTAYLTDLEGNLLQTFRADTKDTVFCAACVGAFWIYLATTDGHCLVFSATTGKLRQTIRDFGTDSTSKTTAGESGVELTQLLHHPIQPIVAAFSNEKTQKKGVLTVWK